MMEKLKATDSAAEGERRIYSAPALEKGLDILEMLCRSEGPLSQKEIAKKLGRSVGEIYRMVTCLVDRNYVAQVDESSYTITTKLYELSHINPPTHRLLFEAMPIMQRQLRRSPTNTNGRVFGLKAECLKAKAMFTFA